MVSIDILIIKDEQILLGLFSKKWSSTKSTYGLPGRELLFGEKFGEAIHRNVREELACSTESFSIIAVNANYAFSNHYIGIGATAKIRGEPQVTRPEDWQKWAWFRLDRLPDDIFPSAKNLIACYRSNLVTVTE